ncbi:MAG: LysM peptidoglycan-binding domain-containing protein [Gemmatimonadota bacterium]|nr:LysM peptidoglycan-binding domain-containing protein [Gemmatimonadota bacterium]
MQIPRFGWSIPAAALVALVSATPARAQDVPVDASATHTVKRGDTLWDLAQTYLGDAYLWPTIYRLNTDQIEDPHWIYPQEVLRLPGSAPMTAQAEPVQQVIRAGPSVFRREVVRRGAGSLAEPIAPARVPIGDVLRASYVTAEQGPRSPGKLLFSADIPGIAKDHNSSNFQLYDKVLMDPPPGSIAGESEKFISYQLGQTIEGFGTIVIPTALLQVVRAPRNGEAAIVEVLEVYGSVNGDAPVIPLDTVGAGASGTPSLVTDGRVTTIRAIHREAVLPSLDYDVIFELASRDGIKVGDEVEIFRPRIESIPYERPAIPEVRIATGRVVRVTPYGSTARITSLQQPAIKVGESVRLTARMP